MPGKQMADFYFFFHGKLILSFASASIISVVHYSMAAQMQIILIH